MLSRVHLAGFATGLAVAASACAPAPTPPEEASAQTSQASLASAAPAPQARRRSRIHEGGALARAAFEEALYVADEDQRVLRRIPLPVDDQRPNTTVRLPGAPAQVLPLDGLVLVTIRDPGLLVVLRTDPDRGMVEVGRVSLPADAWGLAVTPDESTALVTSAFSRQLSAIDLPSLAKRWSLDLAREPRAVVVRPDGDSAYVTHLAGRAITRVDRLLGEPIARGVDLPPTPVTSPVPEPGAHRVDASLAYSAVLSPDGSRLFVPRHALGATVQESWFGRAAVDVMLTEDDSALAPARLHHGLQRDFYPESNRHVDASPQMSGSELAEPRAIVYRHSAATLLVASEGADALAELDATSLDPALHPLRIHDLHGPRGEDAGVTRCGAPTGLALSADESMAYVFCRSTDALAIVTLDPKDASVGFAPGPIPVVKLGDDPLPDLAALGRRLFYDAHDPVMGGDVACAGCHPDGRDDGHVWHEGYDGSESTGMMAAPVREASSGRTLRGAPRQTPMLAGRVSRKRFYGWRGKSTSLEQRIIVGFGLHRWRGTEGAAVRARPLPRAEALAAFLRKGLVAPPADRRDLTPEEELGQELFASSQTRCATCHFPATGYTDGGRVTLAVLAPPAGFLQELEPGAFKTPSLLFVGASAPYFHDGREATLEGLIDHNHDRMGRTEALTPAERSALVAFLKTIGTVDPALQPDAGEPIAVDQQDGWRSGPVDPAPPLAEPDPGPFDVDPPPETRSAPPTWPEWTQAAEVHLLHQNPQCHVFRVREWVRVNCEARPSFFGVASVELVSGPVGGVDLSRNRHGKGGEMVFPVRRGDRRVVSMHEVGDRRRYSGLVYGLAFVVTEAWLPGASAPVLTVN